MKQFPKKALQLLSLFWSFVLLFVIASVLEGVVFYFLWEWFVVSLGVKSISLLHAIGICILLDFVTYHYYDYKKSEEVGLSASLAYILIRPVIAMVVGAAVHFLM